MMKKALICGIAVVFLGLGGLSIADSHKGPADMVLQAEKDVAKKPKPSVFPHQLHQEKYACADCHHGAENGKKVPYTEGMEIQKCESCHYSGNADMPKELSTYKDAAHENCRSCHKEAVAENPALAEKFKGCMPCHPKT